MAVLAGVLAREGVAMPTPGSDEVRRRSELHVDARRGLPPCLWMGTAAAVWVISGGTGSLGALSASWLGHSPSSKLRLLGRSVRVPSSAAIGGAVARLQRSGAALGLERCDSACASDAMSAAALSSATHRCSLLHSAGVLADALWRSQEAARVG